jgi:hypothetical protein
LICARDREIQMLQRVATGWDSDRSAEFLLTWMRAKVDGLCCERAAAAGGPVLLV